MILERELNIAKQLLILKVEMLSIQINTIAMLLSEFDFLPIYRADLAGSRTLSFSHGAVFYTLNGENVNIMLE